MATLFFLFWIAILSVHALLFLGALVQPLRRRPARDPDGGPSLPSVDIVVPVRGDRGDLRACLTSLATLDYPGATLIVCIGDETDPGLPAVRAALAGATLPARCVVGRVAGLKNDKLQLVANGYRAGDSAVVLMTDDNMLWRGATLRDLAGRLDPRTGLVSGVTTATGPTTLWGRVEQSLINGYFNRLMLVGDLLGIGHATGKVLLFRRADLDAAGGPPALNHGVCEDAALREQIETLGLRTVLSPLASDHPIPDRSLHEVWHRQLRWFRCRRAHGGLMFWLEPLIGMAALVAWSLLWGVLDPAVGAWLPLASGVAAWIALEAGYLFAKRLPVTAWLPLSIVIREAFLPFLWVQCLIRGSIDWRGNSFDMATGKTRGGGSRAGGTDA